MIEFESEWIDQLWNQISSLDDKRYRNKDLVENEI